MLLGKSGTGKNDLVKMVQIGKIGKNDTVMLRFPKPLHLKLPAPHPNSNIENVHHFLPCDFHLTIFTSAMFYLCKL